MTIQTIGLGATANDGTGDDLRAAGAKINANFTELEDGVIDAAISAVERRMVTVIAGNSMAAAMKWATDRYTGIAEQIWANALAGVPMEFPLVTPTTRMDQYGCYGYSSQTSTTILQDLPAQFFIPLVLEGVKPDQVWYPALFENDLISGFSAATMLANALLAIRLARTYFPGCRVHINTPGPSYLTNYNLTAWNQIIADLLALDNGKDIFITDCSTPYEQPGSPAKPISWDFTATISGTTMTVSASPNGILPVGCAFVGSGVTNGTWIQDVISVAADGAGTYKVSNSHSIASPTAMKALVVTDNGPHPNARGALIRARAEAVTFRRMAKAWAADRIGIAANPLLYGSTAASGTNVSGTMISGMTVYGNANVTVVAAAQAPGFQMTVSGIVDRTSNYSVGFALPAATGFFTEEATGEFEIEIVSGAKNIRFFSPDLRLWDNGGADNWWGYGPVHQSLAVDLDFNNGDVLTFRQGPFRPKKSIFTQAQQLLYIWLKEKPQNAENIVIKVRHFNYGIKGLPKAIPITTSTLALTRAGWSDRVAMFDRAAGGVVATLPAATGSGDPYAVMVKTNLSSGSYQVKVASASDVFVGSISAYSEDTLSSQVFKPAADGDTLTLNGGTTGGRETDMVFFIDEAPGKWAVSGSITVPTGSTAATPFSATV